MTQTSSEFELADDPSKISGERIRQVRSRDGLTLEDLAGKTGISVSHLSRMESGKRGVSFKMLTIVASALDVPVRQLFPIKEFVPMLGYILENGEIEFSKDIQYQGVIAHENFTKHTRALRTSYKNTFSPLMTGWTIYYEDYPLNLRKFHPYTTSIVEREDGSAFFTQCTISPSDNGHIIYYSKPTGDNLPITNVKSISPVTCMLPTDLTEPEREVLFRRRSLP